MVKLYYPVFAGHTEEGEKIVIYSGPSGTFHLRRGDDGEMWALPHGSAITWADIHHLRKRRVTIESELWSGVATGSTKELVEEEAV